VVFIGTYQNVSQSPSVEAFVDYLTMKEEVWRGGIGDEKRGEERRGEERRGEERREERAGREEGRGLSLHPKAFVD
jgi:hypothetical protein